MSLNLVFDINETLLDTAALNPIFERLFGEAEIRKEWFLTHSIAVCSPAQQSAHNVYYVKFKIRRSFFVCIYYSMLSGCAWIQSRLAESHGNSRMTSPPFSN